MKIMLYTPAVPTEAGGVQGVFNRVALGLDQRGHDVKRVWPIRFKQSDRPDLDDYFPSLDNWPGLGSRKSAKDSLWMIRQLVGGLRRHRPDVVNVHFVRPGARHLLRLRKVFGYKLVLTFHGSDALCPDPTEVAEVDRLIRRADALTAVSPLVAERLRERMGQHEKPVQFIPNGIDHAFWSQADHGEPRPDDPPIILAVGRLKGVKDHATLIEAFALARRDHLHARLVILGDGECEADLRERINTLDLQDFVELPGRADAAMVRDWLGRASLYVLPSESEGMPLSLLEAMAAGVPCLATAVGGVPLLAGEGPSAHLVPPSDPLAMAEAVKTLMKSPSSRDTLVAHGRQRARDFTQESMIQGYESFLSKVVKDAPTAY